MEYSEGEKEGEQSQSQHTSTSYPSGPQEPRQPQHQIQQQKQPWPQQQQQQQPSLYAQQQRSGVSQSQQAVYSRHPYPQQEMMSKAGQPVEYPLPVQQQPQHSQSYMRHPPYAAANVAGYPRQYPQQLTYQQQLAMQQSMIAPGAPPQQPRLQHHHVPAQAAVPYLQPKVGRLPPDRPLIKLSVSLIDTYKTINAVYYEERDARRAARAKEKAKKGQGSNNSGWDDENYDYIISAGELFYGRYKIKERIGKGSFGQVVRAEDIEEHRDVAIKIIKSKKPFLMQAKTEIELLDHLNKQDVDDQYNIVRLLTHFMYRNHQCLVFEMLSLNLYELLKNTQFCGVSLNLIRKFAKQVLRSLSFLARQDIDIIHCDLKPENILLRHPKKSGIKVIDFGSSCRSNKRMYSYIQSRFYRSPEVMLGLPYSVSIDTWSLGCILAEMHTGEPLFSGSDQFDQMQKIVKILGMLPNHMLEQANDTHRLQFFERVVDAPLGKEVWMIKQQAPSGQSSRSGSNTSSPRNSPQPALIPSTDPIASLTEVIRAETQRKKKHPQSELDNSNRSYELFVDLIHRMLAFDPQDRITPNEALNHPFIANGGDSSAGSSQPQHGGSTYSAQSSLPN